ncbi:hypothetical protein G4B88_020306 [Cannabis sativa]|uniref:Uncharacterized protein n=1 Tax=Cannabis sativa TaxID=3483 RepID=A0A7J6EM48_CANSA|nr:hypothetical protein G4B88_020306 [Cannabis sativa]
MTYFDEVQDLQNPSMVLDTLFCEEEDFEDEFEEKKKKKRIQDFWAINIIYYNNNEIEPFNTVEYHLNEAQLNLSMHHFTVNILSSKMIIT